MILRPTKLLILAWSNSAKLNCAPGIGPGVLVIPGITNDCKASLT